MEKSYKCAIKTIMIERIINFGILLRFLIFQTSLELTCATNNQELREYCQLEQFNATCTDNQIVLMTFAKYGRMKVGRCLATSYFVGCHADVMHLFDKRCSGKQKCSVHILDPELVQTQPCRKDLMAYLEASYTCISVPESTDCPNSRVNEIYLQEGHISFGNIQDTTSSPCIWKIKVKDGQRIVFSAYNFQSWITDEFIRDQADYIKYSCDYRLIFEDKRLHSKIHVCERAINMKTNTNRLNQIFTSSGSTVDIHLQSKGKISNEKPFILHYKAIGCRNLVPAKAMWIKRTENTAMVTCNYTKETWHLVCRDQTWIGELKNCSDGAFSNLFSRNKNVPVKFQYGILIAVSLGLVLGILLGSILLLCLMQLKKRRKAREQMAKPSPLLGNYVDEKVYSTGYIQKTNDSYVGPSALVASELDDDNSTYLTHKQSFRSIERYSPKKEVPDIIYTPNRRPQAGLKINCTECNDQFVSNASTFGYGRLCKCNCQSQNCDNYRIQSIEMTNLLNMEENRIDRQNEECLDVL